MRYKGRIKKKFIKEHPYLTRRDRICGKIIEYGILGLVIFAPLPAASVEEWSILVIQLTVLAMMVAYFVMKERPQNNELLSLALYNIVDFIGIYKRDCFVANSRRNDM